MDSNHRRLRQLSYSQPHLATLVTALVLKNSLLFCGYKYRTFSIRCKILNTKIQWIICENSTYSPISLTTKLIFTYGVYIHVYPNCTLISVNMYITALLIIFFTFWQPLCHFQDLLLKPDKWLNNSIMKKSSIIGVLILCFAFWGKAQVRNEIRVPDPEGYRTLKCPGAIGRVISLPLIKITWLFRAVFSAIS